MQHIHTLRVDLHRLSVDDPVVVAGGMGHDALELDLDNEWDGLICVIDADGSETPRESTDSHLSSS